jgi:signal transduction histidine kinase
VLVDGQGRIVTRNAAADRLLSAGAEIQAVLEGSDPPLDWQGAVASAAEARRALTHRNITISDRLGRRLTVDLTVVRLDSADGPMFLLVLADVSDRLAVERQLAASERLSGAGELAAKLAHELNNPLDGVLRLVGLAQRVAGPQADKPLQSARAGLMRLAGIVRDLLGGPGPAGPRLAAVETLLQQAIDVMQPRAQAQGVAVACDLAGSDGVSVPTGLFQVFCNVVRNALDAMSNGGLLSVRVRRRGDRLEMEFADTGCGIPPEQAEAVFQPFYTTKPPGDGCGLGLTICREVLARCGGTITAGPREGGGARVLIELPIGPPAADGGPGGPTAP